MKELSIIVPIYNTPLDILGRTLKSIDNNMVDVIIIDDGSNCEVKEFVQSFTLNKGNFKVVYQENMGAATARKNGLNYLSTKYFTFVDCDDISHIDNLLLLLEKMKYYNVKIGNGRSKCYLPNIPFGFLSKKWDKEYIDLEDDKKSLSNVTCVFWDKIYHEDMIDIIKTPSTHTQYHDMEVVYPALIEAKSMVHINKPLYEYRMRRGSSCNIELSPTSSLGISKLLESYSFMLNLLKEKGFYKEYKQEIDAIIIKLLFQRASSVITSRKIVNKKELVSLILDIMESVVPNYKENKYYQDGFKDSELNDYIFYLNSLSYIKLNHIKNEQRYETTSDLLAFYDKKIILRK